MKVLNWILIIGFALLALIHFYWAFGGKWAFEAVLPQNVSGKRVLNPRPTESGIVGFGLLAFGAFYFVTSDCVTSIHLSSWISVVGSWLIPVIFLLRSTGDFKYVGFFKSISTTSFARLDTYFLSPLCLAIAVIGFILLLDR